MKRSVAIILLIVSIVMSLCSCAILKHRNIKNLHTYTAVFHEDDDNVFTYITYEKNNVSSKNINIFGKDITVHYEKTQKTPILDYEIDIYKIENQNTETVVALHSDTNKIIAFRTDNFKSDRNNLQRVTPDSSEEDFIEYAKKVLLEQAGVDAYGWKVRITTTHASETDKIGFESHSDEAIYTFSFYKTIGGVKRSDKMQVKMTNYGEVIEYDARNFDMAFELFSEAMIDISKLKFAVLTAFNKNTRNSPTNIVISDISLVTNGNELWVLVQVSYSIYQNTPMEDNLVDTYAVKVAEF